MLSLVLLYVSKDLILNFDFLYDIVQSLLFDFSTNDTNDDCCLLIQKTR